MEMALDEECPPGIAETPKPKRSHGKSFKRCDCGLSWCNQLKNGEIDQGGRGYPFGKVALPKGHPVELKQRLVKLKFQQAHEWTDYQVAECVQNPRGSGYRALVLRSRLDWNSAVQPPANAVLEAESAALPSKVDELKVSATTLSQGKLLSVGGNCQVNQAALVAHIGMCPLAHAALLTEH